MNIEYLLVNFVLLMAKQLTICIDKKDIRQLINEGLQLAPAREPYPQNCITMKGSSTYSHEVTASPNIPVGRDINS